MNENCLPGQQCGYRLAHSFQIGSNGGTLEGTRVHFDDQEQIRQESDADVKSIDVLHVQGLGSCDLVN